LRGDPDAANLSPADRALLDYAAKITQAPASLTEADTDRLRDHGFSDAQLWEAAFIAASFNMYTRMADAFGIVPPPHMAATLGLESWPPPASTSETGPPATP
jgi:uncharacterized peroxidase-related enzyme